MMVWFNTYCSLRIQVAGIGLLLFLWLIIACRAWSRTRQVTSDQHIRFQIKGDLHRVIGFSLLVLIGWLGMYSYAVCVLSPGEAFGNFETIELFVVDLFQNMASIGLLGMYAGLAAPRGMDEEQPGYWQGVVYGSVVIFGALTIVEALVAYQWPLVLPKLGSFPSFGLVYGLIQGVALYLFIGRANDSLITDQLISRYPGNKGWPHGVIAGLYLIGFLYAGFQSFFSELMSEKHKEIIPLLLLLALFFKFFLIVLWWRLIRNEGNALSPLENHLYETHRFNTEERKSYARNFLRKHVNPMFMKGSVTKNYLGLEFHIASKAKLKGLGFGSSNAGPSLEGILVTSVYPGGPAMRAGILPGDLIHTVRHQPVCESGALTKVLVNTKDKEWVHLTYSRASWTKPKEHSIQQFHCKVQVRNYAKLKHRRSAKLSKLYLGAEVIANHHERGVLVKALAHGPQASTKRAVLSQDFSETHIVGISLGSNGPYYPILDRSTLRAAMSRVIPGEMITIHTPDGPGEWSSYGPFALGTTVHWQPVQARPVIERVFLEPDPDLIKQLEIHPVLDQVTFLGGRFESAFLQRTLRGATAKGELIADVHLLDSRSDLVFSYAVTSQHWRVLERWPIWSQMDGGDHTMLVILRGGHPMSQISEPGTRIGFCYSLSVERSQRFFPHVTPPAP